MENPQKFDASRPDFQGHSRSLELTRIDRLLDFLLVFLSKYGLISDRCRDKVRFAKFSHPLTFNAP